MNLKDLPPAYQKQAARQLVKSKAATFESKPEPYDWKLWLPIRTVSEANQREHWAAKAKRAKGQRILVASLMRGNVWPDKPLAVTLRRICKDRRGILDDDNLARSFKAVRDEVAKQIGRDDGDDSLKWIYEQKIGGKYAVEIEVKEETNAVGILWCAACGIYGNHTSGRCPHITH